MNWIKGTQNGKEVAIYAANVAIATYTPSKNAGGTGEMAKLLGPSARLEVKLISGEAVEFLDRDADRLWKDAFLG